MRRFFSNDTIMLRTKNPLSFDKMGDFVTDKWLQFKPVQRIEKYKTLTSNLLFCNNDYKMFLTWSCAGD